MPSISLSQILAVTQGQLQQHQDTNSKPANLNVTELTFDCFHSLEDDIVRDQSMALFKDKKYFDKINSGIAKLIITNNGLANLITNEDLIVVVVKDPYVAFAKIAQLLDTTPVVKPIVHPTAVIADTAKVGNNVHIGPFVVIGENVVIGDDCIIESHCSIGDNCILGQSVRLHPHVVLYHSVVLDDNVVVHSLTVLGADGFGYANEAGKWIKIPQVGTTRIGANTEIGSLTSVDRGALKDTIVEKNVILDNHIHLGHNVRIGEGTAMAGGTIVAGSTSIGKYCIIGGASVFNGHIYTNDFVTVTGMAMVSHSLTESHKIYSSGIPVDDNKKWLRSTVMLKYDYLRQQSERIKHLENAVSRLESLVDGNVED